MLFNFKEEKKFCCAFRNLTLRKEREAGTKQLQRFRLCGGGRFVFDSEERFFFQTQRAGAGAELGAIVERCCHHMAISSLSEGRRSGRTSIAAAAGSSGAGVRWLMGMVAVCFRVVRNSACSFVPMV